jgi:K+-sensing histidine kinase KdpD
LILNGLEGLQEQLTGVHNAEVNELLNNIGNGARRLSSEISDILTYITAPDDVRTGPKITVAEFQQIANESALQLGVEILRIQNRDALPNQKLMLSHQSCELILWELLENSRKYHPQNNPVIDLIIENNNNTQDVNISLLDNGSFISSDQLAKCWAPYTQEEKYFTGEKAGMGLGLSCVATVVWRAGGTCRISNRHTPGVAVELTIPRSDTSAEAESNGIP